MTDRSTGHERAGNAHDLDDGNRSRVRASFVSDDVAVADDLV